MTDTHVAHRILVPLDGSDLATVALPWLRAIARPETEVVLVRVESWGTPMVDIAGTIAYYDEELQESSLIASAEYLQRVADALKGVGASITPIARSGMPADEILRIAEEQDVDLIIMATHGYGAVGRALLGSIADRVARAADIPVLLIHPDLLTVPVTVGGAAEIQRVVVPLDGSERANAALPVATALARQQGVPMRLLRVVPSRADMFANREAAPISALVERMVFPMQQSIETDQQLQYYEEYVTAATDALSRETERIHAEGAETSSEVLIGPTVPMIVSALSAGDVVVMCSHGQGGVRRWQLGSIAEKLIHRAAAPILLVPDLERKLMAR